MIINRQLADALREHGYTETVMQTYDWITLRRLVFDDGGIRYNLNLHFSSSWVNGPIVGTLWIDGETEQKMRAGGFGITQIHLGPMLNDVRWLDYVKENERTLEEHWVRCGSPYYWTAPQ